LQTPSYFVDVLQNCFVNEHVGNIYLSASGSFLIQQIIQTIMDPIVESKVVIFLWQ